MHSKGIALMLVISAIMLISMIVLEFVYGTNVNYRLAVNSRQRLQAEYLAESALNLMRLELRLDQQAKSAIASSPIAQYVTANISEPLCQQFPLSTALLRGFFIGGELPPVTGGGEEKPAGEEPTTEKSKSVTAFETETAQEFLNFEGDFDGQCTDEQSKFNLNVFADLDPVQQVLSGANPYDSYKMMLSNFLKQDRFKELFKEPEKIDEMARNLADWADKNDLINDFGYITRGNEDSLYTGEDEVRPRNAKYISLDEVHLVSGVGDDWFAPLEDSFTVYGEPKINVCLASDDMLWALILTYAGQQTDIPPLNPKDEEKKKTLLNTVRMSCGGVKPEPSKIAADLSTALGVTATGQAGGQGGWFANMITAGAKFYTLKTSGQVGDTMVNIKTVLDITNSDPKKWKTLYYKVY